MVNQKDSVFAAVIAVLAEAKIEFVSGTTMAKTVMTKELRTQVNQILFQGFRGKTIEMDGEKSDADLKQYVSGLQSNWLNKDKRLNGSVQYAAKNPGSRTGVTDPQVKALRGLLAQAESDKEKTEIQEYLDDRLKQLGQAKAKTVEVNIADLPEALRAKYEVVDETTEASGEQDAD